MHKILIEKITGYKNWIGKLILWLLGIIIVISQNYSLILKGFLLTDKDTNYDSAEYIVANSFGILFIVGGVYLNKFLDKFTSK